MYDKFDREHLGDLRGPLNHARPDPHNLYPHTAHIRTSWIRIRPAQFFSCPQRPAKLALSQIIMIEYDRIVQ